MSVALVWQSLVASSRELKVLGVFTAGFAGVFFLPLGEPRFDNALQEGLALTKWYAREHVLLCLVPALFIAGGISVFVNQASVMRYLGPSAPKPLAYGVASVSGTILAVCSCTVLPLFGGIWTRGAGLGPATTFLYSGPAINVLAIVMTARILGIELGAARAIGAVVFSVVIGLLMHLIFRREEAAKAEAALVLPLPEAARPLWQNAVFFAAMVGLLVFANWSQPVEATGLWAAIHAWKWPLSGGCAAQSTARPAQPATNSSSGCCGNATLNAATGAAAHAKPCHEKPNQRPKLTARTAAHPPLSGHFHA